MGVAILWWYYYGGVNLMTSMNYDTVVGKRRSNVTLLNHQQLLKYWARCLASRSMSSMALCFSGSSLASCFSNCKNVAKKQTQCHAHRIHWITIFWHRKHTTIPRSNVAYTGKSLKCGRAQLFNMPNYVWCGFWNPLMFEHVTTLQFLPSDSSGMYHRVSRLYK